LKLIALETATEGCSAALFIEGDVAERFELAPRRHTELILPMVEALLADAGLQMQDLDAVAFGRGPGSFTGVRIATAVAQGLAFGADLPLVPVSTLAALAQGAVTAADGADILAVIDARMNEVYVGQFTVNAEGLVEQVIEERVCAAEQVTLAGRSPVLGVGSGFGSYGETLAAVLSERLISVQPAALPRAADVVRLAVAQFRAGQMVSPEQALPVYLRDNVAALPPS